MLRSLAASLAALTLALCACACAPQRATTTTYVHGQVPPALSDLGRDPDRVLRLSDQREILAWRFEQLWNELTPNPLLYVAVVRPPDTVLSVAFARPGEADMPMLEELVSDAATNVRRIEIADMLCARSFHR